MRFVLRSIILFAPLSCLAGPLVTITCEPLKGVTQTYGVTAKRPTNHLSGPVADSLGGVSVYVADSPLRTLTIRWKDLPRESAREIAVLPSSPAVITALDSHPGPNGVSDLYSFYPKLGVLLFSRHYLDIAGSSVGESAFIAKCKFAFLPRPQLRPSP